MPGFVANLSEREVARQVVPGGMRTPTRFQRGGLPVPNSGAPLVSWRTVGVRHSY